MSEALTALLSDLRREAGWENTSGATSAALAIAELEGDEPIRSLVRELERADHVDLSEDAGDIGDELWRLRSAIEAGLIKAGPRATAIIAPLLHPARSSPRDLVLARVCARARVSSIFPVVEAWVMDSTEDASSARLTAMECLGHLGDPRGGELIRRSLLAGASINSGWLKRIAAIALGRLQDVSALHVLLDDADWFARLGVLEAVPHLNDAKARDELASRGKADVDERVRAEATRAGSKGP
ncbi:MAG: HEAT repeat domain-containing protein [Archangium sp.]